MKKLIFILMFFSTLAFCNFCIGQSTRNATLIADASVYETLPSRNFGNDVSMFFGLEPNGDVSGILLKFDLGLLPDNIHIHSANLTLFHFSGFPLERVVGEISRITSSWSENTVTLNNSPYSSPTAYNFLAGTGGSSLSIPVTSIVRQWASGYANHGVVLSPYGIIGGEATDYGNNCFFYTKEGSSTYKPQLSFQYSYLDVSPDALPIVSSQSASGIFSVNTNVGWSVSDDASWLTATKNSGSTIIVSYNENTSTSSRIAHITVTTGYLSETVVVQQAGASAYVDISTNNLEVNSSGGTAYFNVGSNAAWSVSDDVSWLTVSKTDESTITVSYDENLSTISRTANITTSGSGVSETVTLVQSGIPLYIDVSPNSRNVDSSSGTTTYNVDANVVWGVSHDISWVSATKTDENTITITYDENLWPDSRTALIVASGSGVFESVSLVQLGSEAYLDVSTNNLEVNSSSGTTTFDVSTNVYWSVSDDVSWLTVSKTDESTITVDYSENVSTNSRTANITASGLGVSQPVSLIQSEAEMSYLSIFPEYQEVSSDDGSFDFDIFSNSDWKVFDDAGWLTVVPFEGNSNGTITATFTRNETGNLRIATVLVSLEGIDASATIVQNANITEVNTNSISKFIRTYPNPVKEIFFIEHECAYSSIKIFSLSGQIVAQFENIPNYFECNLSSIEKGFYLIQFITDKGYTFQKIVVE